MRITKIKDLTLRGCPRISEAIRLYASGNMDFIDAYNIAYIKSKEYTKIATFDSKHFKKVEGISIL